MFRESYLNCLLLMSAVSGIHAMDHNDIVLGSKLDSLSGLSQEAFSERLKASIKEQRAKEKAAQQAKELTLEDLHKRKDKIVADGNFEAQIAQFCTGRIKQYKALNPRITDRQVAEKLQPELRAFWKRRFHVFYKATYKDWSSHEDALKTLTNGSVDESIALRPELAILLVSDCCVIL